MLELKNIHKSFGDVRVLNGENLCLEKGRIYTLKGGNGSGKTTLQAKREVAYIYELHATQRQHPTCDSTAIKNINKFSRKAISNSKKSCNFAKNLQDVKIVSYDVQ
ncbi:hypothetical protein AGMMS49982_07340 [Bacteroidia bacterium]|nr:hypothetical protein AGMMS49982_07340 [Bacteroidia bacterium]